MIIPRKIKPGDMVRVIAPARTLGMSWLRDNPVLTALAQKRLEDLGLRVSFGAHVHECDEFESTTMEHRIDDLHAAFADPDVRLVLCVIGGYNSNQLLEHIDYGLIARHPKAFCGYSDITALSNAIYAQTGMVTYAGPMFFSFGMEQGFEYTLNAFRSCLMSDEPVALMPSQEWSDDRWAADQSHRIFMRNAGYTIINPGEAHGTIIGGNLCTFNLLHGTPYMPDLRGGILFIEDDGESHVRTFDRNLQSLMHQPGFDDVRGIVFGRFQRATGMTPETLHSIIMSKPALERIPIIANLDFGHTMPMFTFPIGGTAHISMRDNRLSIEIPAH